MLELLDKLDIQGKIDAFGVLTTVVNVAAEICEYLEIECNWPMLPSTIVSFIIATITVLIDEYKIPIIIALVIITLYKIYKIIEKKVEDRAYNQKHGK